METTITMRCPTHGYVREDVNHTVCSKVCCGICGKTYVLVMTDAGNSFDYPTCHCHPSSAMYCEKNLQEVSFLGRFLAGLYFRFSSQ